MSNNSNYNKISVKTDTTVELLEQLAKLGFFKEKRKSKPKRSASSGDIRQTHDMAPGYAQSLLMQTRFGMTPQQIADIQDRNNATVAALSAEVEQNRLEDAQRQAQILGKLTTAAAGRFGQLGGQISQLESAVGKITNIESEHFRGAQEPGAGVYDPFRSGVILLGNEPMSTPDIKEGGEAFTQTLNEGGPTEAPIATQTKLFGEEGGETGFLQGVSAPGPKFASRNDAARDLGLGEVPDSVFASAAEMKEYYFALMDAAGEDPDPTLRGNIGNVVAQGLGLGPVPGYERATTASLQEYYSRLMTAANKATDPKLTTKKKLYKGISDYLDSAGKDLLYGAIGDYLDSIVKI
jgi:hypothetical protein